MIRTTCKSAVISRIIQVVYSNVGLVYYDVRAKTTSVNNEYLQQRVTSSLVTHISSQFVRIVFSKFVEWRMIYANGRVVQCGMCDTRLVLILVIGFRLSNNEDRQRQAKQCC